MKKGRSSKSKKKIAVLSIVAVVIIGILAGILSVALSSGSKEAYRFSGEVINGIDVSSHNGKIDWDIASKEVDFAFIRAGYRGYSNGNILPDKKMKENLKNANENNLPVGVYFYSQAINEKEAVEEAEFVIKAIRKYDIGLPIVIDFEYAADKTGKHTGRLFEANLTQEEATNIVNAFCNRVEKSGYNSAVYASTYFYNSVFETKKLNKSITLWVADYNEELTYKGDFDIWQYTNKGKCNGVTSKNVDLNHWYLKE